MPRYAAFLRGVMPTNAKMAGLRRAFEAAGFRDVKTVSLTTRTWETIGKAARA